jgi:hypothetical protein
MSAFRGKEQPPLKMAAPILLIRYQRIYHLIFRLEFELQKSYPYSTIIIIITKISEQSVREDPTFEMKLDIREIWRHEVVV